MLDFIRLGSEQAVTERRWTRRLVCRLLGHRGVGFAVKLWTLQRLLDRIPRGSVRRILDFGCGDGMYTFFLRSRFPEAEIDAVDGDEAAVAQANQIAARSGDDRLRFHAMRFEDFRPVGTYDLVVCLDAIYYVPDGVDHLATLCRCVADRGHLVLSSAHVKRYYGESFKYYLGWVDVERLDPLFSPQNTGRIIEEAGLDIVDREDYPSAWATSIIERQRSGSRLIALLYPLYVYLTWLGRRGTPSTGTRYMYLAGRWANSEKLPADAA